MIVTVTPNPALDLTWRAERVVPGGSHRVDAALARAGGKGVNVARVAHAQGAEVLAVTTAGGPVGEEFASELRASGVPHRLVPVAAETRRSAAIVDETLGDTMIFNERGTSPSPAEWAALLHEVQAALPGAGVLVVSGSLPRGADPGLVPRLLGLAAERGLPVVVDVSGPAMLAAAAAGAALLKPNRAELADATGLDDPVDGARELLRLGARRVLCSLGAEGLLLIRADAPPLRARLPEPLAGNPTGAGDAAVAAAAVLLHDDPDVDDERLLVAAASWSAAAVLAPGAGEISPRHPELAARLIVDRLAGV
ncbi:1-phosphofructokinase family hexose kinase [Agromyces soli]|uniref:Hexose kinase n=1 Tax=Agromyces soli TaxID=659012 RepID=A0ABY4ANE6_9MICO|nr:hexose kinase [Agromyces soli]UOE24677.1 hexose kinase [Agromyces soli]